jgi:hypothetical protein
MIERSADARIYGEFGRDQIRARVKRPSARGSSGVPRDHALGAKRIPITKRTEEKR